MRKYGDIERTEVKYIRLVPLGKGFPKSEREPSLCIVKKGMNEHDKMLALQEEKDKLEKLQGLRQRLRFKFIKLYGYKTKRYHELRKTLFLKPYFLNEKGFPMDDSKAREALLSLLADEDTLFDYNNIAYRVLQVQRPILADQKSGIRNKVLTRQNNVRRALYQSSSVYREQSEFLLNAVITHVINRKESVNTWFK